MGTREDFISPEQQWQIQRLFYIPYILQSELQHSLDTQIFILALRHYSSLITSTGRNLQEIILQAIFCAIGPERQPPPPPSLKWSRHDWKAFMKTEIKNWSSWAWRCRCDSQSWDDGFNQEICVSTLSPQNRNVKMCVMMKTIVLAMILRVMRKKMVMRMILMFWMVRFCKKTLQVLSR